MPRGLGETFRIWRDSLTILDPTQTFLCASAATYEYLGVVLLGASAWREVEATWAKEHPVDVQCWADFEGAINAVFGLSLAESRARLLSL